MGVTLSKREAGVLLQQLLLRWSLMVCLQQQRLQSLHH